MSTNPIIVQGTIRPDGTLELNEPLQLPAGRVQVTVQPLPDLSQDPFWQRLETTWAAQRARGQTVPTETEHQSLNAEMEEEIQAAMRLQNAAREARKQSAQTSD